ncbi:MAG: hypothetical protein LW650_08060 [Planctomycetaceae bacterium]|nr:hypothetical protein [Phycisphaerales bacterium]MCE2653439.1 hypothetical protein [Planctomycetaceae bacterium]
MRFRPANLLVRVLAGAGSLALAASASAQLRPDQVLVVYDSRIPDSLAVAEHYAGSAAVPGGLGNLPGTRPGVRVVDLASLGGVVQSAATISRSAFNLHIRDRLRTHLAATDAPGGGGSTNGGAIRCLVLTKGLPHRILQSNNANVGDNPSLAGNTLGAANYNSAALDAELVLLWQNLDAGENNGPADSPADGFVVNPYWRQTLPIEAWRTRFRRNAKTFSAPTTTPAAGPGILWSASLTNPTLAPPPNALTPGDIYLVSRLDGHTVADVRALLDRSAGPAIPVNVDAAGFILDESNSDGVLSPINSAEFDTGGFSLIWNGDDYEQARDTLLADRRFAPANVRYDRFANKNNFLVGSRISYGGQGLIVDAPAAPLPVILLASYGSNHEGTAPGDDVSTSPNVRTTYAESFTYAPGAVFNTMESYNGRQFNNVEAGGVPQEQAADFIAAGGSFAIGNVFEPFTLTVPDNDALVKAWHLGNLSWAEAAFSSLPVLSFQQIVIGDPLARLARSSEDRDADARLSVDDLYSMNQTPADINRSGVADDADRALVERAVRSSRDADMRSGSLQRP